MAGPIQVQFTLTYTPPFTGASQKTLPLSITATIAGSAYKESTQNIPTTAGGTAIVVAGLTTPRWCAIINRDPANFVQILTAVAGTAFAKLLPGEGMLLPFDPGIAAPAALANTAACQIELLLIET